MNENNEVFGAKVSVDTTEAKNKFKQLGEFIRNFGKKAEDDATIMPKLVNTGYQNQINYVKKQMQEIYDNLKIAQKRENEGNAPGYDVEKLKANYEKLSYILEDLLEKQKEFNGELEETTEESTKTKSVLSNMFDHSISKIKRFTFYLLGARSAFSLFRKYQSIYYQYNEQMQYQSELSQNAIALSLAPAFELLGNVIAYASIGFAKFIELLTGVNVLSKVSTKGIRDYNKQLKEQRTLLSGIDEITNLDKAGAGTGLASQYQALDDFQKKVKQVEEFFKKNTWIASLVNGIKTVISKLGEVVGYIRDHWDVFKYIIGGVALASFLGFALTGAGLGTMALVGTITILGIAEAMKKLDELLEKYRDTINKMNPQNEEKYQLAILNEIDTLVQKLKKLPKDSKEYQDTLKEINQKWQVVNGTIQRGDKDVTKHKDEVEKVAKALDEVTGKADLYGKTAQTSFDIAKTRADWDARDFLTRWGDVFTNAGKKHDEYLTGLRNDYTNTFDKIFTSAQKEFNKINNIKLDKKLMEIGVKYNIPKSTVQSLIDKVRGISVNLFGMSNSAFNNIANSILKKFGYAKGLDYVPYDEYPALLHKGEAVVPAKYNPSIHSTGNEYTNSLLETLIVKVEDLSRRPNVFEIDGQKFATATYSLYENEGNRQNYIEGVVK